MALKFSKYLFLLTFEILYMIIVNNCLDVSTLNTVLLNYKLLNNTKTKLSQVNPELENMLRKCNNLELLEETILNFDKTEQEKLLNYYNQLILTNEKILCEYQTNNAILKYNIFKKHEKLSSKIIYGYIESKTSDNQNLDSNILINYSSSKLNDNKQTIKIFFDELNKKNKLNNEDKNIYNLENQGYSPNYYSYFSKVFTSKSEDLLKDSVFNRINTLFINQKNNQNNKKFESTLLIISGDSCNSNKAEINFYSEKSDEKSFSISLETLSNLWREYQNMLLNNINEIPFWKKLLVVVDCPNGNKWVDLCNKHKFYKEISVVSYDKNQKFILKDNSNVESSLLINYLFNKNNIDVKEINNQLKKENKNQFGIKTCGYYFSNLMNYNLDIDKHSIEADNTEINYISKLLPTSKALNSKFDINNYSHSLYMGMYSDNSFNGLGKIIYNENLIYRGEIKNNKKHGIGVLYTKFNLTVSNITNTSKTFIDNDYYSYEGHFKNDIPNGYGIMYGNLTNLDLVIKEGIFKNEVDVDGIASLILLRESSTYIGTVHNNTLSGFGNKTMPMGFNYIGEFYDNKFHGNGKLILKNHKIMYKGTFNKGDFTGDGYMILNNRKYVGRFESFSLQGKGEIIYNNGTVFIGEFEKGKRKGEGKMISHDSEILLHGEWDNDNLIKVYNKIDTENNLVIKNNITNKESLKKLKEDKINDIEEVEDNEDNVYDEDDMFDNELTDQSNNINKEDL